MAKHSITFLRMDSKRLFPVSLFFRARFLHQQCKNNNEHNKSSPISSDITLLSTFNKQSKKISGAIYPKLAIDSKSNLNMYCCGPTVYDHSHIGHAITYIRCDLVKRTLKQFCNLNVFFAMNITDIDDKIISKSRAKKSDYRSLSTEYCQSFLADMDALRIKQADCYLKVTDHIDVICDYIRRIYDKGFAYHSFETGDINFDYEKFVNTFRIENALNSGRNLLTDKSKGKKSPKDFALWKQSKPDEPKWRLSLNDRLSIDGRPGWHVECSALSNHIFGANIDLHFGGFDLIFPHHHCESCCSHAYSFDPSKPLVPLYSSAKVWLHSGHLILRSEKMSKSLGNVVLIKDFLQTFSPNVIRLLCIRTHYRTEIDFDQKLLYEMSTFDEKLREFVALIDFYIYKLSGGCDPRSLHCDDHHHDDDRQAANPHLSTLIDQVEHQIMMGILNDLDLNLGLEAIVSLSRVFPKALLFLDSDEHSSILFECIRLRLLIQRWLATTGLEYGVSNTSSNRDNGNLNNQLVFIEHISDFRSHARQLALGTLRTLGKLKKSLTNDQQEAIEQLAEHATRMLAQCDDTRTFLDTYGIKLKDQPK